MLKKLLIILLLSSNVCFSQEKPENYEQAVALSKAENKKLFLYFTSESCSWCEKMKETFCDKDVKSQLKKYIFYTVLIEKEFELTQRYGISLTPTCILNKSATHQSRVAGYMDAEKFKTWLKAREAEK